MTKQKRKNKGTLQNEKSKNVENLAGEKVISSHKLHYLGIT